MRKIILHPPSDERFFCRLPFRTEGAVHRYHPKRDMARCGKLSFPHLRMREFFADCRFTPRVLYIGTAPREKWRDTENYPFPHLRMREFFADCRFAPRVLYIGTAPREKWRDAENYPSEEIIPLRLHVLASVISTFIYLPFRDSSPGKLTILPVSVRAERVFLSVLLSPSTRTRHILPT